MLKYLDTVVSLAEVPDELSLCINISNCPCHCEGCHSPYLAEDIGEELTFDTLFYLCNLKYKGVSCVCFMGGDSDPSYINLLAGVLRESELPIKTAWYSGRQELSKNIDLENFDVIKLGNYEESLGPLNFPTTNQRFYKIINGKMYDYTYLFWKDSEIEIWKDLQEFPGYQISNLGNVKSLNYNGKGIIQILKSGDSGPDRGYKSVSMQVGNKVVRRNIHGLVATTFIPNPYNLLEINHIDKNGHNNKINNLEWC